MTLHQLKPKPLTGYVHSIESMGTVDGPGIRTVVFLSGCPLRCAYCHNIDVTVPKTGDQFTPEGLVAQIKKNKTYFDSSGGGVTFSGGDPLYQTEFLAACLALCQEEGIHTAVDTSLFAAPEKLESVVSHTDLFLVSVKGLDSVAHQQLTGVGNEAIMENLAWLARQEIPVWIRYVLLPGKTDTPDYLAKFCKLLQALKLPKIEVLPYHTAGTDKWAEIGLTYDFETVPTPTKKEIEAVINCFETAGFEVLCNQ